MNISGGAGHEMRCAIAAAHYAQFVKEEQRDGGPRSTPNASAAMKLPGGTDP